MLVHDLPPAFGRNPRIEVLDVQYGPGGRSGPHRHGCPVVGYVLEGTLRTKLQGGPVQVFGPGEAFYENPTDTHEISENARSGGTTRFLAVFVCDDDRPLSTKVEHAGAK